MREIPRAEVVARLRQDNAWWESPHRIAAPISGWQPRPYLDVFLPHFEGRDVRRALVLMGPRRVGKTVMIHHAIAALLARGQAPETICYVSVDHPVYNGLGLEDLLDIYTEATGVDYKTTECFVVFDEIQYLKDWEVHLKALVDRYDRPKLIASGSAAAALRLKSSESGAGRITDFLLPPLTFHEFLFLRGESDLVQVRQDEVEPHFAVPDIDALNKSFVEYLNFGGYPEVVLSPVIQSDSGRYIKADIIDKVLLRDLPSLYGIQDIQELNSLFTTLAYNTAQEVSLEGLSKNSGVAKNTIKKYIEYLEAAFLLKVIHRVDQNARRFKRAGRFKVYLTNPSIRSALFSPIDADHESMGALVETAIYAQWFHAESTLHYARWNKGEVDMVMLDATQQPAWVLEAKWSDSFLERGGETAALVDFCGKNEIARAVVTTRSVRRTLRQDGVDVHAIPASEQCFLVGYNLVRQKRVLG